jgi:hypothetical protein
VAYMRPKMKDEQARPLHTAYVLCHAFNLFPEVVELCSDLLDYISEDESNRAIGLRHDGATIMAKVETIELPE